MNPLPLLPDLGPVPSLALAASVLVLAYAIFTLTGFGSALVASAPLATVMPVARIIPLLALLDCLGSARRGWRQRRVVDGPALRQLVPAMLLGQWLGVGLLTRLPAGPMAVLLGGFVVAYGLHALRPGAAGRPAKPGVLPAWRTAWPAASSAACSAAAASCTPATSNAGCRAATPSGRRRPC